MGERKNMIIDALSDNKGSTSFVSASREREGNLSTSSTSTRERQTSLICSVSKRKGGIFSIYDASMEVERS
jgi:hypothetical protein